MHTTPRKRPPHSLAPIWLLIAYTLALGLCAVFAPALAQSTHYHAFADTRTFWGLPYAMDVLSNLPLLIAGLAMAWQLQRCGLRMALPWPIWWWLLALAVLGFVLTALASSLYHVRPDDAGVLWDRLAMSLIFAAVIGLAFGQIAHAWAAASMALVTLVAAITALLVWRANGNFSPWIVVQAGGMLLLLAAGLAHKRIPSTLHVPHLPLLALIGCYALAKLAEWGDHAIFELSSGLLSGHSLKHILAALAAWPLLQMLYNAKASAPGSGTPATRLSSAH